MVQKSQIPIASSTSRSDLLALSSPSSPQISAINSQSTTSEPSWSRPPFHSPPTNANCRRAPSRPRRQSSSPSSATWQRCATWRSPPTRSTRPNWSMGFATYTTTKRPSPSAWRPRSWRKIASSPLIAITVLSSIFLSLWIWNFVELFGLLRFSGFMGCWKLFGIFWVVHVLVCGDFSY